MALIRNSNQVKQCIDFYGIQNGNIHPSDIDAVLEFNNEALILFEVKRVNNKIPTGQRLLLERICDSWHTNKSVVLFITHSVDEHIDIPLHSCNVDSIYWNKSWYKNKERNLKKILNNLGEYWKIEKLTIK